MSVLLIYSNSCKHSMEAINFIENNKQLKQVVNLHNINQRGIPPQYKGRITHVPTLLTKTGKFMVGKEVLNFLESLLPSDVSSFYSCSVGTTLEGEDDGGLFSLDSYGQSLQPAMTPQLEEKIKKNVNDAYDSFDRV